MSRIRNIVLLLLVLALLPVLSVASPASAQETPLVSLGSSEQLGKFLVGKDGMTLYNYPPDPVNESVCYDQCATAWPPLIVESADKITAAEGIPGVFGTATRKDGALQVTYNGQPLYYWARDKQAGDTTGHRVGRIWWVVAPATVDIQYNQKLGPILVGPKGMTLYMFTKDTENVSNCYDQCATNWPPLLVNSADEFVPGSIVAGKFDFIARKDGGTQVTYNGMPLYYWKDDKAIGDTTGENVGEVWFTVPAQVIASKNTADLGDFLVSNDGMTLYLFTKDAEGVSNCSGDCAKAWPPYTVSELHKLVTPPGMMGKLDKIKRDDGNFQVTYNGMPLYFYTKDTAPGDTTGQKVGDVWFVVKP